MSKQLSLFALQVADATARMPVAEAPPPEPVQHCHALPPDYGTETHPAVAACWVQDGAWAAFLDRLFAGVLEG